MANLNFDLKKPCEHCPFRTDVEPYLTGERALEIVQSLERGSFPCHETTAATKAQPRNAAGRFTAREHQQCAGAMILQFNEGKIGDVLQVAERLGFFRRAELRKSPVFKSFRAFIEAQGDEIQLPENLWRY